MENAITLVERIASSDARRVAIMGLTPGAGKATTLGYLLRGLQDRGEEVGIVAAGREEEDVEFTQAPRGLSLPLRMGTVVATSAACRRQAESVLQRARMVGSSAFPCVYVAPTAPTTRCPAVAGG